jgi:1-acylglycerone phosphate reductase
MAMTRSFIDLLIAARGLIINVASISALVPYVFGSVYASSKAAVCSYSRTLRQELRPFGVRVQVVMAGAVRSNISANTAKTRVLPEESLYARVRHLYERRQGYSQSKASGSLPTEVFATTLVDRALAREVAPFWRSWFGRPDWLYYGGMTRLLWWGSVLGEWVTDLGAWKTFGLRELEAVVETEPAAISGGRKAK